MITVISGTNRPNSRTLLFANQYAELLREAGEEAQVLDLATVSSDLYISDMYDGKKMSPELKALQETFILGVRKFAFLVPEYNGSYPGVLKLFLDGISVNAYGDNFTGKFAALIGIASGRAGNLRGIDHLAASLSHMGGWVLPNRLPISGIEGLITDNQLTNEKTIATLKTQAQQLIAA